MNNRDLDNEQVTVEEVQINTDFTLYVAPYQSKENEVSIEDTILKEGSLLNFTNNQDGTCEDYIVTEPNKSKEFIQKKVKEGYEVSKHILTPVHCQVSYYHDDWLVVTGHSFKLREGEQLLLSKEKIYFKLLTDFEIKENNKVNLNGFCGTLQLKDFSPKIEPGKVMELNYNLKVDLFYLIENNNYLNVKL